MSGKKTTQAAMPADYLATFNLDDAPGHLLRRCQQLAVDLYTMEVGVSGLTPRQFALMLAIYQNPGISQVELVRLTGIDRSTVAEMVARLIKRGLLVRQRTETRSEEHTSELQSLMRISYAVFCLKKKKKPQS